MLELEKFFIFFSKIWTEKVMGGLPNQNDGKTDKNTMITFSVNNFSAPSESQMFIFWLFHQFTTPLLRLLNRGFI